MKNRKLKMSGSVYSNTSYSGLTIENGRLVNNRPDGQTGIQQASQIKKSMKRANKVLMISEGVRLGEM